MRYVVVEHRNLIEAVLNQLKIVFHVQTEAAVVVDLWHTASRHF
jgi:hypothetical protein